jgi:hypothetical protein
MRQPKCKRKGYVPNKKINIAQDGCLYITFVLGVYI